MTQKWTENKGEEERKKEKIIESAFEERNFCMKQKKRQEYKKLGERERERNQKT